MNLENDFAPLLLGLLFGAGLGVVVTDLPEYKPPPAGSATVKPRLWQRILLGVLVSIFISLGFVWILAETGVIILDLRWFRYAFGGVLIGFLSAPWIWLHFARDFLTQEERGSATAPAVLNEYIARYRLLTIMLGVILLVAVLGPQFLALFTRAKQVNLLGLSVSISERPLGGNVTSIILPATGTGGASALDKLTQNTSYAHQIWNSTPPESTRKGDVPVKPDTVGADLKTFDNLSIWDRDRAFIAYFSHSDRLRRSNIMPPESLSTYILQAEQRNAGIQRDEAFLIETAPLFACLDEYAKEVRDVKLYFLRTGEFLRELSMSLRRRRDTQINIASAAALWEEIERFLKQFKIGDINCRRSPWPGLTAPSGATPYPTLLLAFSLAAVESPETGIFYITDWIAEQDTSDKVGTTGFARQWYLLRAEIELESLATQYIRPRVEPERRALFQRQLTDGFRELLQMRSIDDWRKLCAAFDDGRLHSRIGRRLTFNYAVGRNYLFELQTPAMIQLRYERKSDELQDLPRDLDEASTLANAEKCYTGVPVFEGIKDGIPKSRPKWLAQFKLNLVQLRIGQTVLQARNMSETEIDRVRDELSRIVEEAAAALGAVDDNRYLKGSPDERRPRRDDQLLKGDGFDDQRARIPGLKSLIASLQKA